MLGHIRQDQVGGDGRHLIQTGLAELALDVVFIGKAEAAVGLQAGVGGLQLALAARYLAILAAAPALPPVSYSAQARQRIRSAASSSI